MNKLKAYLEAEKLKEAVNSAGEKLKNALTADLLLPGQVKRLRREMKDLSTELSVVRAQIRNLQDKLVPTKSPSLSASASLSPSGSWSNSPSLSASSSPSLAPDEDY